MAEGSFIPTPPGGADFYDADKVDSMLAGKVSALSEPDAAPEFNRIGTDRNLRDVVAEIYRAIGGKVIN